MEALEGEVFSEVEGEALEEEVFSEVDLEALEVEGFSEVEGVLAGRKVDSIRSIF